MAHGVRAPLCGKQPLGHHLSAFALLECSPHCRSALCSRVGEGQQDPAPGRPGTWRAASFPFPGCLLAGARVVCIPAGQLEDTGPAWTPGPALPTTSFMLYSRGLLLHLHNADSTAYPALPCRKVLCKFLPPNTPLKYVLLT